MDMYHQYDDPAQRLTTAGEELQYSKGVLSCLSTMYQNIRRFCLNNHMYMFFIFRAGVLYRTRYLVPGQSCEVGDVKRN